MSHATQISTAPHVRPHRARRLRTLAALKDNPAGVVEDWNAAVRLCPDGVPIFGEDLPAAAPAT